MTLSPAFLDELRARTTLSALIAPTVKLTKAGREYKACCRSSAHGDAIRFLTDAPR